MNIWLFSHDTISLHLLGSTCELCALRRSPCPHRRGRGRHRCFLQKERRSQARMLHPQAARVTNVPDVVGSDTARVRRTSTCVNTWRTTCCWGRVALHLHLLKHTQSTRVADCKPPVQHLHLLLKSLAPCQRWCCSQPRQQGQGCRVHLRSMSLGQNNVVNLLACSELRVHDECFATRASPPHYVSACQDTHQHTSPTPPQHMSSSTHEQGGAKDH
jgi:hypothetical protein